MKDLSAVSKNEQKEFIDSFDYVFCDVDGVLWNFQNSIPGASLAISSLQAINKKVIYVSNNSTKSQDDYYKQIKSAGFSLDKSDLIQPSLAIVDFLKTHNITKDIYLLGMTPLRTKLEDAGFKIEQLHLDNPEESTPKYVKTCITPNENIGAVVLDLDLNMTVAQVQKAATYLKNPEVVFVTGGQDKRLCFGPGVFFIGPGEYHGIVEDVSGRKPHVLAKPSRDFGDFINKKLNIKDPGRVLFIGDSVQTDMAFGTNCGYQKLLVLSGLTTKENLEKWSFPEEYKPKYYAESLKTLGDILER